MFYFASPMNAKHMDYYMQRGLRIVQKMEEAGIKVYFPQRDTNQSMNPKKIHEANIAAIRKSQAFIIILSNSRGIYLEAGYAKGQKKPIIGLRVGETSEMGPITRNFLDYFVNSQEELIAMLKKLKSTKKKS